MCGPNSLTMLFVQPTGILIYFKEVNPESSFQDQEKQKLSIFLQHCGGTWKANVMCADLLRSEDLLHALLVAGGEMYPESLFLVYSNNVIERYKLESHVQAPPRGKGLQILQPK